MSKQFIPWGGCQPELASNMTLRDYFAAAALAAEWMGDHSIYEQAELAYKVADAMLAERAKKEGQT